MNVLAALALSCSLARAATPPLGAGTTSSVLAADAATLSQDAKTLLNADDLKTALADAEAAVADGGGADAYAARAEAKLALGRPLEEAISDYAEAARLDPRYGEKYNGLLVQFQSETRPDKSKNAKAEGAGGVSITFVLGLAAAGLALLVFGLLFLRLKKSAGKSASEL